MSELPKTFDPAEIEARWYAHWEETGAFRPARPDAEPFTIVMPPPNVTGSLHIGHALDVTLQDILVRHARLKGKDALWVAGTDHAGIATQMVVERQMMERQERRADFTREQFVERVWDWKAESGGAITRQLRRLGASCDWANERFTMDPGFSKAVIKVFVDLYNEGLLYRDKRLVNWDPGLKTAISDLEVETREVQGKFWHLRYPLADGYLTRDGEDHIVVATTRPETMLADMAVAVHPDDQRYQDLVGRGVKVRLPITGREIPIIADEHADPELGSGAVKITPGHDFNDFEVGKRAGIAPADMLNMLDAEARIVQTSDGLILADLLKLTVAEARPRVVALLEAAGALERVEARIIATPFGDRSGAVIEPWLTDQWYVDAKTLAGPAIAAVKSGAIEIVPKSWEKTWFQWLENIQPWCVSRQLWWGHRIPAWYGPIKDSYGHDGFAPIEAKPGWPLQLSKRVLRPFVAETVAEALQEAQAYYGDDVQVEIGELLEVDLERVVLAQDNDVLDTWFSSALWPFATLGWPGNAEPQADLPELVESLPSPSAQQEKGRASTNSAKPEGGEGDISAAPALLAKHYPNDVLISGFDILFFWDARMAMQGLHFMGEAPWKTLYLHGLVRAPDGAKMSKSKGNTVDPLGLIDRYGADALRFFMAAMESQGRDIKMDERRLEGYRNFATKLWNAARFLQGNGVTTGPAVGAPGAQLAVNKWIIGETVETLAKLDAALAAFRFDEAANAIYHFVWDRFCDWYLELIKGDIGVETQTVAGWVFDQILVMLHPFMPFITEELWHAMGGRACDLIHALWPEPDAAIDDEARAEVEWVIEVVDRIRSARTELNVSPAAKVEAAVWCDGIEVVRKTERWASAIARMVRTELSAIGDTLDDDDAIPRLNMESTQSAAVSMGANLQIALSDVTIMLNLGDVIDLHAERARLAKSAEAAEKEAASLAARLANPAFVERAKPEAVAKARADHAEKSAEAERLRAALARLG